MADRVDVDVIVEAIAKGFDKVGRDISDLGDEGEDLEQKMDRGSSGVSALNVALGNMAAEGLMKAGRAIFQFGVDSISAASDVEEMSSKFNAVFKDLAGSTEAELDKMAGTINRSKFDLMEYAATIQDTFVPLGFARDAAADMSVKVVALAEDLASFNNLDTATVVRDLQSALVGNTETLRKYGVVAQETQIKAKAMELGLWDGTGAIDAQSKAATILELTLKGTTDAQGDALLTADSFANKQKGLEAAMLDVQVAIGEKLLPTLTDLVTAATEAAESLSIAMLIFGSGSDKIRDKAKSIFEGAESLDELRKKSEGLNKAWKEMPLILKLLGIGVEAFHGSTAEAAKAIAGQTQSYAEFEDQLKKAFGRGVLTQFEKYIFLQGQSKEEFYEWAKAAVITESNAAKWERRLESIKEDTERWTAAQEDANEELEETTEVIRGSGMAALAEYNFLMEQGAGVATKTAYAQGIHNKRLKETAIAAEEAQDILHGLIESMLAPMQNNTLSLMNQDLNELGRQLITVGGRTGDQNRILGEAENRYDQLDRAIVDYTIGLKGLGMSQEDINKKVGEFREEQELLQPVIVEMGNITGTVASIVQDYTWDQDALTTALFNTTSALMTDKEAVLGLAVAFGELTPIQAEALLQQHIMATVHLPALAAELASGAISADSAREALLLLAAGTYESTQEALAATGAYLDWQDVLDAMAGGYQVRIDFQTHGVAALEHALSLISGLPQSGHTPQEEEEMAEAVDGVYDIPDDPDPPDSPNPPSVPGAQGNVTVNVVTPRSVTSPYYFGSSIGDRISQVK